MQPSSYFIFSNLSFFRVPKVDSRHKIKWAEIWVFLGVKMWLMKIERYFLGFAMKISNENPYPFILGESPGEALWLKLGGGGSGTKVVT